MDYLIKWEDSIKLNKNNNIKICLVLIKYKSFILNVIIKIVKKIEIVYRDHLK